MRIVARIIAITNGTTNDIDVGNTKHENGESNANRHGNTTEMDNVYATVQTHPSQ